MKILLITLFVLAAAILAYARVDVDLGLGINAAPAPVYYSAPPDYYVAGDEAYWMDAPVRVVYYDGVPHRMHWWHNHWYDESWASGGRMEHEHWNHNDSHWEHQNHGW